VVGTGLLAVAGIRLPDIYSRKQRVESAYRKEHVHGKDDAASTRPPTLEELFADVRKPYFRLCFQSIHKRLAAFEAAFEQRPLPDLDQAYLAGDTGTAG
jgi:peptide/bleomycin uptake transporter